MTDAIQLADSQELGKLLRAAREGKGLSRPQLAARVNLHRERLLQIEQGYVQRKGDPIRRPTLLAREKLIALCNALQVPPDTTDRILTLSGYAPMDRRRIVYLDELPPDAAEEFSKLFEEARRRP